MCFYHYRQTWVIIGLLLVNLVISTCNQSLIADNSDSPRKGVPDRTVPGGTRYNQRDHSSDQGQIANPEIEIQGIV